MSDKKKKLDPSRENGNGAAQEKEEKSDKKDQTIKELREKLEKAEAETAEKKNDYLRLMAEFDTFRRRSAEERLSMVGSAAADTIKGLLPILDDCEIALAQLRKSSDSAAAIEGTELIYNKLKAYLKSRGLEEIQAKGEPFDTELHEAVTLFPAPSEDLKGKVIEVAQTGYLLSGKVLRYAKVIVGS